MQSYDLQNQIKNAFTDTPNELARKALIELESAATSRVVIGKMPQYRELVLINGLVYKVKFVNRKTGELTLKLVRKATEAELSMPEYPATVASVDLAAGADQTAVTKAEDLVDDLVEE